jgi:hypothetical protein
VGLERRKSNNCIEGREVEFGQVVTQTRNIPDTSLRVIGEPARCWMAIAQCFAGPPEDPPAPRARVPDESRSAKNRTTPV